MKKPRIYCAFTGTGKTYFCQHHAGGADIDEQTAVEARLSPTFLARVYANYIHYGYRIITNATPYVFQGLVQEAHKYEIIIILPPPEMKDELLERVKNRGDTVGYPYLCSIYDDFYKNTVNFPIAAKKIGIQPGQYLSDIIEQYEEENLD